MNETIKKKSIKIGLMGLDFVSANLGCQALSYGFLKLLQQALLELDRSAEITAFSRINKNNLKKYFEIDPETIEECILTGNRTRKQRLDQIKMFKNYDLIFDFTAGDSFSDIYGIKRFISCSLEKENVIRSKTPLVLGNQTYGPFNSFFAKNWAKHIVKKSDQVFTRDHISAEYLTKNFNVNPFESVDVAFALPYFAWEMGKNERIKIGFNASGLLWNGGYTGNNQFGLKVDYRKYCEEILTYLTNSDKYEVHLIGHVLSNNLKSNDNDLHAINEIKERFPSVIVAPIFTNPIEVKSYISKMDVFIGARMHATIGAFSSGVPTIPFAYSRKFKGVFNDLKYDYVIDGCDLSTETAVDRTIKYINEKDLLKDMMSYGDTYLSDHLIRYVSELKKLLTKG